MDMIQNKLLCHQIKREGFNAHYRDSPVQQEQTRKGQKHGRERSTGETVEGTTCGYGQRRAKGTRVGKVSHGAAGAVEEDGRARAEAKERGAGRCPLAARRGWRQEVDRRTGDGVASCGGRRWQGATL